MPTPLDFESEQYFFDVRNTDYHFPSERFNGWLSARQQQNDTDSHLTF